MTAATGFRKLPVKLPGISERKDAPAPLLKDEEENRKRGQVQAETKEEAKGIE